MVSPGSRSPATGTSPTVVPASAGSACAPATEASTVMVVFWNDRGEGVAPDGTVEIRAAGDLVASAPVAFGQVGDVRVLGTLDWRSLGWSPDGSATTHDALGGPPFNE